VDRGSQVSLSDAQSVRRDGLQARSVSPHDGVPDCLFKQEANFHETTKLPQAHKTALNKRSYPVHRAAMTNILRYDRACFDT